MGGNYRRTTDRAARGGDDVLVGAFASIRGRSDDMAIELVASHAPNAAAIDPGGEGLAHGAGWRKNSGPERITNQCAHTEMTVRSSTASGSERVSG